MTDMLMMVAEGMYRTGAIMMMVLESVGLKVDPGTPVAMAYAMIFGIGAVACNVTGDLAVTCAVAKSENEVDLSFWE